MIETNFCTTNGGLLINAPFCVLLSHQTDPLIGPSLTRIDLMVGLCSSLWWRGGRARQYLYRAQAYCLHYNQAFLGPTHAQSHIKKRLFFLLLIIMYLDLQSFSYALGSQAIALCSDT